MFSSGSYFNIIQQSSTPIVPQVLETMGCPQLASNMRALSQAVYSDQLPLLCQMLGLGGVSASPGQDLMELFLKAMETKHKEG